MIIPRIQSDQSIRMVIDAFFHCPLLGGTMTTTIVDDVDPTEVSYKKNNFMQ